MQMNVWQIHKNIFNGRVESFYDSAVNLNDLMTALPFCFCQAELDLCLLSIAGWRRARLSVTSESLKNPGGFMWY